MYALEIVQLRVAVVVMKAHVLHVASGALSHLGILLCFHLPNHTLTIIILHSHTLNIQNLFS